MDHLLIKSSKDLSGNANAWKPECFDMWLLSQSKNSINGIYKFPPPPKNWIWNHFKNVGQKFAVRKCILEYIYTFSVKGEKTMLEDSMLCRVLLLIRTINIILCVGTNNIFFFLSKLIYFDHHYDSWYFEWTQQRKRCSFFQHMSFNLKVV